MMRQVKPILQRGMGFSGHDGGRFDTGTRESSLGEQKKALKNRDLTIIEFLPVDSDNAYSTYPLIARDRDRDRDCTKDESSSSTIKASNDQIATSSILHNSKCGGSTTST